MTLVEKKQEYFTYKDYKDWPSDERWELIHGQAFNMSPAPTIAHQKVVGNIFNQLSQKTGQCKTLVAPVDVLLKKDLAQSDDDSDTIVQPDVLVICDKNKIGDKNIKGAPDLVVEVLSPATAKKDEGVKRDLYQDNGVKEYWLVHPIDQTVNQYILTNGIYEKSLVYGKDDTITISFLDNQEPDLDNQELGLSVDLSLIFES